MRDQAAVERHPAEKALRRLARALGGGIHVISSPDQQIDVTMPGLYRVEVREMRTRVVVLKPSCPEWDDVGKAWLISDGTAALGRILNSIATHTDA